MSFFLNYAFFDKKIDLFSTIHEKKLQNANSLREISLFAIIF